MTKTKRIAQTTVDAMESKGLDTLAQLEKAQAVVEQLQEWREDWTNYDRDEKIPVEFVLVYFELCLGPLHKD